MSKKFLLLLAFGLVSVQPKMQIQPIKTATTDSLSIPAKVVIIEQKTDSLIADAKMLENIQNQTKEAKKELKRLDILIKKNRNKELKEIKESLKKFENRGL